MSINQAPKVSDAAYVSQTFFSLPVYMQVGVIGYAGQITETSMHMPHPSILKLTRQGQLPWNI